MMLQCASQAKLSLGRSSTLVVTSRSFCASTQHKPNIKIPQENHSKYERLKSQIINKEHDLNKEYAEAFKPTHVKEDIWRKRIELTDDHPINKVISWDEKGISNLKIPMDRQHLVKRHLSFRGDVPTFFEMTEYYGKLYNTPLSTLHKKQPHYMNSNQTPEPEVPPIGLLASNIISDGTRFSGACRRLQIHRPEEMNTIDINLARNLRMALQQWDLNDTVTSFITHTSSNAKWFCTGHDFRALYNAGKGSNYQRDYFREVYNLVTVVHSIKKPSLVVMDGATYGVGGAIGLTGQFRYTTLSTVFSVPEVLMGYFPDAGNMYYLSKLPNEIGTYLMLTGRRINAADMHYLGLANYHAPGAGFVEAIERALGSHWYDALDDRFMHHFNLTYHQVPSNTSLPPLEPAIQRCFSKSTIPEIMAALKAEDSDWGDKTLAKMMEASPLSLRVTLEYLQRVRNQQMELEDCLRMEYRISQRFMQHDDFYIGVRNRVLNDDEIKGPIEWTHMSVEHVPEEEVMMFFTPLLGDIPDIDLIYSRPRAPIPEYDQIVKSWNANNHDSDWTEEVFWTNKGEPKEEFESAGGGADKGLTLPTVPQVHKLCMMVVEKVVKFMEVPLGSKKSLKALKELRELIVRVRPIIKLASIGKVVPLLERITASKVMNSMAAFTTTTNHFFENEPTVVVDGKGNVGTEIQEPDTSMMDTALLEDMFNILQKFARQTKQDKITDAELRRRVQGARKEYWNRLEPLDREI